MSNFKKKFNDSKTFHKEVYKRDRESEREEDPKDNSYNTT